MKATIDRAGRIVVPKPLRDELSLRGGEALELSVRDGRLEAVPMGTPMRLERRPGGAVAVAEVELPPLSAEDVRATLERTRR